MKTGCMRAAGRTADTRTPPHPRSDARLEPRRRARKATHPVMRGRAGRGRLAVWAAFAGINASICCHQRRESGNGMRSRRVGQPSVVNPSLRHTSRPCASRRAAQTPDMNNTNKTNDHERPFTPTGRRPGPASPSPRSRDGDPNAANCPTSRSADSSDTANPTSTDGSKTTPSTRRNDGNQKKQCTRCVPDGQAPEKTKGRNR